jgi:hypothetical protein
VTVAVEWKSYARRTTLHPKWRGGGGRRKPLQRPVAFNPMCRSLGRLDLVTSEEEKDKEGREWGGRANEQATMSCTAALIPGLR